MPVELDVVDGIAAGERVAILGQWVGLEVAGDGCAIELRQGVAVSLDPGRGASA